jgi:DMSO/TMAO reductase YedYZ molybdopterin-dependent catalytic subunit
VGDRAILATHVNGAPLSNNHGFPLRLIVPGYPGQNMVKQIDRITVQRDKEKINPDFKLTSLGPDESACVAQAMEA